VSILENSGKAEGQQVLVSNHMEARLSSIGFEILSTTPEKQLVSTREVTKWRWQIKAKEFGYQPLYLSLNAILSVDGKDATKSVRTLERKIIVQVTSVHGLWAFLERYWLILGTMLTAILIPSFIYIRGKYQKAKKNKDAKAPKNIK
jgi:hypothetical protein